MSMSAVHGRGGLADDEKKNVVMCANFRFIIAELSMSAISLSGFVIFSISQHKKKRKIGTKESKHKKKLSTKPSIFPIEKFV